MSSRSLHISCGGTLGIDHGDRYNGGNFIFIFSVECFEGSKIETSRSSLPQDLALEPKIILKSCFPTFGVSFFYKKKIFTIRVVFKSGSSHE